MNKVILNSLFGFLSMVFLVNCKSSSDAVTMGEVQLAVSSYSTSSYKVRSPFMELLFPSANAIINSGDLKLCFKRLRLKPVEDLEDDDGVLSDDEALSHPDNVDFELGEVTLDGSGTVLSTLIAPVGDYRRIEIDLEDQCSSGKSVSLTNNYGTFYTDERVTIRFEGLFTVEDGGQINLPIANIINSLNSFNPSNPADQQVVSAELKQAAEVIGQ